MPPLNRSARRTNHGATGYQRLACDGRPLRDRIVRHRNDLVSRRVPLERAYDLRSVSTYLVSSRTTSVLHKKTIQIGGIASTAFTTLTVTLLHDVMVGLALVCFVVALSAVLYMLYRERGLGLFALGILFVAIELGTAVLYFAQIFLEFLPAGQKAALVLIGLWLVAVHHRSGVPKNSSVTGP